MYPKKGTREFREDLYKETGRFTHLIKNLLGYCLKVLWITCELGGGGVSDGLFSQPRLLFFNVLNENLYKG